MRKVGKTTAIEAVNPLVREVVCPQVPAAAFQPVPAEASQQAQAVDSQQVLVAVYRQVLEVVFRQVPEVVVPQDQAVVYRPDQVEAFRPVPVVDYPRHPAAVSQRDPASSKVNCLRNTLQSIPDGADGFAQAGIRKSDFFQSEIGTPVVARGTGHDHIACLVRTPTRVWKHMVVLKPHGLESGVLLGIAVAPA